MLHQAGKMRVVQIRKKNHNQQSNQFIDKRNKRESQMTRMTIKLRIKTQKRMKVSLWIRSRGSTMANQKERKKWCIDLKENTRKRNKTKRMKKKAQMMISK
jgi:hypothetical protein